jgi:amino acid transporter
LNQPHTQHGALRRDALGIVHSTAIGIAGTAPAYSIAASTATLVAAVGGLAPASLFYCGLIMVGITLAFMQLNRVYPHAGASYEWVSRVFGRRLGFLTGWTVLVSSALFMVSATIPAATATLLLIAPGYAEDKMAVLGTSAAWLVVITIVVARGMHLTGVVQTVMTSFELVVLLGLTILALVKFGPALKAHFSWSVFAPQAFTLSSFASGAVIALFFFWGWDVALNVSEETPDSSRTPALAAGIALMVIVTAFMTFALVTLATLSEAEIRASGANVVFAVAEKLIPRPWSYAAVIAVLVSSIGTVETSVLQFGRTLFAKSRAGVMHERWSKVHARWKTPHLATGLLCLIGLVLFALSLAFKDIESLLRASINAIGLEIAFYYGLAAAACAWHFRHAFKRSLRGALLAVVWPLLSALALWGVAARAALDMETATIVIGVGAIVLGLFPMWRALK